MEDTIKEVLWEIPHVKLVQVSSGDHCLIVEDIDVNDFVEDHLWDEYEYDATSVVMQGPRLAVYYNYYKGRLHLEGLLEALQSLDPVEVEKIFRRNH